VVESVSMVVFNDDGDQIEVNSETGVRFMLIAGAPFKEPIVPYGPFVMNTVEEIQQTIAELRNGTFIQ
ncbi:MAG: pirin-like C-terminal cupin domain-containing protein, partial [Nitrospirota bacterium]|nr:pirin-like C-terminal cupin domain-containing protein [Nitrospirota bacterium]